MSTSSAALVVELPCLRRLCLSGQRLTHQVNDQPVALDGTHAMLQLAQDLVLVLDVAALCLPIGEERLRALMGGWCDAQPEGSVSTCRTSTRVSPALIGSKPFSTENAVSKVSCSEVLITMSNSAPLACMRYISRSVLAAYLLTRVSTCVW